MRLDNGTAEREKFKETEEETAEDKKARFKNTKSGGANYTLPKKYLNLKKLMIK
jgi:hypothetical protein